ncbi:MAG: hypothetical protein R3274_04385, partial [Desulfobacterales bacterium]|nr:hypothetical protein [Desulfobacterales bacterium]
ALLSSLHPPELSDEMVDLATLYEYSIVKKIEKCESQADMLHTSTSATLRHHAELQDKKAQFFDTQKDLLVQAMIQKRLEPKQYKIEHFLEVEFYRSAAN